MSVTRLQCRHCEAVHSMPALVQSPKAAELRPSCRGKPRRNLSGRHHQLRPADRLGGGGSPTFITRGLSGAGRVGWIATHVQVLIPWPRALSLWKESDKPCKVGPLIRVHRRIAWLL